MHSVALPLQSLMMSLTPPHDSLSAAATQLVALGRFPVDDASSSFGLRIDMRGETPDEQRLSVTASRNGESRVMEFSPDRAYHEIFL